MDAIFFTRRQFTKLKHCHLQKHINHTEAELYIFEKKGQWDKQKMILKHFYIDEGEYFSNKLFTINNLIDNRNIININMLIMPTQLAVVDDHVVGYVMPYIENINLATILRDIKVDSNKKINYLKQVGNILHDIHNVKELENQFFLGDIHEGNFIVGNEDDNVYAVDMDSCKIKNNLAYPSKYLSTNSNLINLPHKYPVDENGMHIPSQDSDILCYICMILNTISRTEIYKLSIEEFYLYLEYLETIGFGHDFITCCGRIYTNAPNISPLPYLDQIPDAIGRANYKVFLVANTPHKQK